METVYFILSRAMAVFKYKRGKMDYFHLTSFTKLASLKNRDIDFILSNNIHLQSVLLVVRIYFYQIQARAYW